MLEDTDVYVFDYKGSFSSRDELSEWLKNKVWKGNNPILKRKEEEVDERRK